MRRGWSVRRRGPWALFAVAGEWGQRGSWRGRRARLAPSWRRARITRWGVADARTASRRLLALLRLRRVRGVVDCGRAGARGQAQSEPFPAGCVSAAGSAANGGGPPMTRGPGGHMVPPVGSTGGAAASIRIRGTRETACSGRSSDDPSRTWLQWVPLADRLVAYSLYPILFALLAFE